jgi:quercetin dioxygenase-like cupin family protein
MADEPLFQRGVIYIRHLRLAPGEAMPWHRDPFQRITIVLQGEALAIEYGDGGQCQHVAVRAGQVDWDEPTDRIHRGVNVGAEPYEEITIFFLDHPGAVAQPTAV